MADNQRALVTLALLKSVVDDGKDYVSLFIPLVEHVLAAHQPETVDRETVADLLDQEFRLQVPAHPVELMLRRLAAQGVLEKSHGTYVLGERTPASLDGRIAATSTHLNRCVAALGQFADGLGVEWSADDATDALLAFFSEFPVDVIDSIGGRPRAVRPVKSPQDGSYVVGAFIKDSRTRATSVYESVVELFRGYMLSNVLVARDLTEISRKFKQTRFFLDTPLLVNLLGYHGESEQTASFQLLQMLRDAGAHAAVFDITLSELENLLEFSRQNLRKGSNRVTRHCRQKRVTDSDLQVAIAKLEEKLRGEGISVAISPSYEKQNHPFQINSSEMLQIVEDAINYRSAKAAEHDATCIRNIFVLRQGRRPRSLEGARAVFVTTNSSLARAAQRYAREHEDDREAPQAVTDFALANYLWLKSPSSGPDLPEVELLATCAAATQPSGRLWKRFDEYVEQLRLTGELDETDIEILRSSQVVESELGSLTRGSEANLSRETVTEVLQRAKNDLLADAQAQFDTQAKAQAAELGAQAVELARERARASQVEQQLENVKKAELKRHAQFDRMAESVAGWVCGLCFLLAGFALCVATFLGAGFVHEAAGLPAGGIACAMVVVLTLMNWHSLTLVELRKRLSTYVAGWLRRHLESTK